MLNTLEELIKLIRERKKSSPESSYTKKLLQDKNLILEKVKRPQRNLSSRQSLEVLPNPRQSSDASTWKSQKRSQSGLSFPITGLVYVYITTVSSSRKRVRSEHIKKNLTKDPVHK